MKVIMVLRAPLLIEMLFSRLFSEMIAHTQLFYKNNYLLYVKRGRGRIISRQGVKLQYPLKLGWYCKFQFKTGTEKYYEVRTYSKGNLLC